MYVLYRIYRAGRGVVAVLVLGLVGLAAWSAWPSAPRPARFGPADCGVLALIDSAGAGALAGVEDLATAPDGTLILAARDRRGDGPAGLWRLDPADLGAARAPVRRIGGLPDLAPQGLALAPDGRLAVVDRAAPGIRLGRLDRDFTETARWTDPALCRANDVVFDGARLLATLDRGDCGLSLADLVPWARTGRLVALEATGIVPLRGGIAYANGLVPWEGGLWVAATRAGRIETGARHLDLPGGPDNLSPGPRGPVVALHPDLARLALYRGGLTDRAPSRIVEISPQVVMLWDDPTGATFPAATAAVWVGERLVAGSVGAAGLLVCGPR